MKLKSFIIIKLALVLSNETIFFRNEWTVQREVRRHLKRQATETQQVASEGMYFPIFMCRLTFSPE